MHFSSLRGAFAVFLIAYFNTDVAAISSDGFETHRLLQAATKRSDLYRRSVRITKRFETELVYVENENVWNDEATFASQVKVSSQKPLLNLEEHEHHLQDVQCGGGTMKLHFVDTSSARDARSACHGANGGLIITSHESCNEEGERSVYQVHDVSFAGDREVLELSVSKTTWQAAFDHVNVSFGHTTDDHVYRRHSDFARLRRKRQSKVDIPADTPDNVNTVAFDLASEVINTTFGIESFLSAISDAIPLPDVPVPIEIGCKRCTTSGQIALTQGAFNINASQIDLIPDVFEGGDDGKEITSVLTGGFIELVATGVGARLELFARPASSGGFEVALFQIPITGFVIPGIGKAGAIFEPRIAFDFEVSGTLEVNYGLEVIVPDGSSLRLDLTNLANSRLTGFQESSLTPLPVEVNVTDAEVLLSLAFIPSIPVAFEFLDQLKAEVTPSLELLCLDAKLSSKIADNCGNSSNTTLPGVSFANHTAELSPELIRLGPLALVEANVSLSVDIALDVSLPLLPPPFNAVRVQENIFTAVFPLLSSCATPGDAFNNATHVVIPPPMAIEASAAPMLNASLGIARVDMTATLASEQAAAPTLPPNITFIFASDVVSSTSELIAISTPMSSTLSETSLMNTTSTPMSSLRPTNSLTSIISMPVRYTASMTSSLDTTSTLASETASAPCTTSPSYPTSAMTSETTSTTCTTSLNSSSTLIGYTVSATSLPDTTTSTAAYGYTTSSTLSLNTASSPATTTSTAAYGYTTSSTLSPDTTTTPCDSTSTTLVTRTTYITTKMPPNLTVPASESTPLSTATSTSCSLTSTLTTSCSTLLASKTASQYPVSQYTTAVSVNSTESLVKSASHTSSPCLSSSFIPTYNTSSLETPVLSPSSSTASTTPILSASPIMSENLPPPAPVVTMTVGFLVPSNGSAVTTTQTGLPEFTGTATRVVSAFKTNVMLGWLVGVVGFCVIGPLL